MTSPRVPFCGVVNSRPTKSADRSWAAVAVETACCRSPIPSRTSSMRKGSAGCSDEPVREHQPLPPRLHHVAHLVSEERDVGAGALVGPPRYGGVALVVRPRWGRLTDRCTPAAELSEQCGGRVR